MFSIYDPITRYFFYLLAVNSEQITPRGPILRKSMRALTVDEESVSGALSCSIIVGQNITVLWTESLCSVPTSRSVELLGSRH